MPNEKWLTDVTEFKYVLNDEVKKLYLSAILDLCDKRAVTFVIGDRNDNKLVFDTFDAAVAAIRMSPVFHSIVVSNIGSSSQEACSCRDDRSMSS
jgi:transposase InsO family protein